MTKVIIFKSTEGSYKGFTCSGHAGFASHGSDIVCAAISILVINTINAMEELTHQAMQLETDEATGYIDCRIQGSVNDESRLLIETMILGLKNIEQQYGKKHLRLKFEEV